MSTDGNSSESQIGGDASRLDDVDIIDPDALSRHPMVGTAVRPGQSAGQFVFTTPDEQAVKTGEFVAYAQQVGDDRETMLARVTDREQADGLPESFMADPAVNADRVASTLGVPTGEVELYNITAEVIGYYDTTFESFRNPRQLPVPGTSLYRAPGDMLEVVVPNVTPPGLRDLDDDEQPPAMAHLGRLLNRVDDEVRVELPVNEYAATHLAVLASTGSGKSYTASVLIEEMMQPDTRASMLVFDPHGEYDTLDQMCDDDQFGGNDGYVPNVDIRRSDQLSVRYADLTYGDLLSVLDGPTSRMESVLYDAHQDLRGEEAFSINDLQNKCDHHHPDGEASGLRWRINKAFRQSDFFQQHDRTRLTDIISPGKVTVLQMDGLSKRDQQMMAAVLLRKLYNARQAAEGAEDVDVADPIEHPVFTLFEEAHRFAPDGTSRSLDIIRQINSEGRKFGLGTGLISQRPSKLDPDALSQCGTQIIMQIQNPADQQAIKQSVESAGEAILEELPGLTKGQAVVAGDAVNTPVLVKVRKRHTKHGAESLKADQLWRTAYDEQANAPERSQPANDHRDENIGPETL